MAKHAALPSSSFFKKAVANTSIFALAVTPIFLMTAPSFGSEACDDLDNGVSGATAESLSNGVCQVTFTEDVASWALPSDVLKLSVVGVGAGGGALANGSKGYGGGGGQLNYLDTVDIANKNFNITVGLKGENATTGTAGNAGEDTVLKNIVDGVPATALVTAAGGLGGSTSLGSGVDANRGIDSSWRYATNGIKGIYSDGTTNPNYQNTVDGSMPGAGTRLPSNGTGNPSSAIPKDGTGGAGVSLNFNDGFGEFLIDPLGEDDFIDYLDPTLWAQDSAVLGAGVSLLGFEFGKGGGILATPVRPNALSGQGAEINANGTISEFAGGGVLVLRFFVPEKIDIAEGQLRFDKIIGPVSGVAEAQDAIDETNVGSASGVGHKFTYIDLLNDGAVNVDARVQITAQDGIEYPSNANNGKLESLDEYYAEDENSRIMSNLRFVDETGDEYVEYRIDFLTNATTVIDGAPVILKNVVVNVYDIDSYQYVEFNNVKSSTFGPSTILASRVGDGPGMTRFFENAGVSSSASNLNSRVQVEFEDVSSITIRLGQNFPSSGSKSRASFELDFSTGPGPIAGIPAESPAQAPSIAILAPKAFVLSPASIASGKSQAVQSTGINLERINSVTVDGKDVQIVAKTAGTIYLLLPPLQPGSYIINYRSDFGFMNQPENLFVTTAASDSSDSEETPAVSDEPGAVPTQPGLTKFYKAERFSNYLGDRGGVISRDERAIRSFLDQYQGITRITCLGSTSGVPAIETDKALATNRATNACTIAKKLNPQAEVTIKATTGMGIGQYYRSVTIFVAGTNQ